MHTVLMNNFSPESFYCITSTGNANSFEFVLHSSGKIYILAEEEITVIRADYLLRFFWNFSVSYYPFARFCKCINHSIGIVYPVDIWNGWINRLSITSRAFL